MGIQVKGLLASWLGAAKPSQRGWLWVWDLKAEQKRDCTCCALRSADREGSHWTSLEAGRCLCVPEGPALAHVAHFLLSSPWLRPRCSSCILDSAMTPLRLGPGLPFASAPTIQPLKHVAAKASSGFGGLRQSFLTCGLRAAELGPGQLLGPLPGPIVSWSTNAMVRKRQGCPGSWDEVSHDSLLSHSPALLSPCLYLPISRPSVHKIVEYTAMGQGCCCGHCYLAAREGREPRGTFPAPISPALRGHSKCTKVSVQNPKGNQMQRFHVLQ